MKITCAHCGATAEKRTGHVNRARKRPSGLLFCGRKCVALWQRSLNPPPAIVESQAQFRERQEQLRVDQRLERMVPLLRYCAESGIVSCAKTGKRRGCERPKGWYRMVDCMEDGKKKAVLEHRIAWRLHYGVIPQIGIDHINGHKSDNRICNIRLATDSANQANKPKLRTNTSGLKGVSFDTRKRSFRAVVVANKHSYFLGNFDSAEKAHDAYVAAAKRLHGEFFHA